MPAKPVKMNPTKGLWLRGDVYWLAATVAGHGRVRVSLGTADMAEAIRQARIVRVFPERFFTKREGSLLEDFMEHQERRGISATHRKQSRRVLTEFQAAGGGRLEAASQAAAHRWWKDLSGRVAPKTAKDYLAILTFFYKWAVNSGQAKLSPVALIIRPKLRPPVRKSFLVPADALRVLDECADEELKFCLFCALHCGMRRGEIIASRPHWFDLKAGLLHIQNEADWLVKDRCNRTIPITSEFLGFLKGYGVRSPYMFRPDVADNKEKKSHEYRTDFRKLYLNHMARLGIAGVTFHDLRRTFASLHVSRGTPLYHVAKWLGDHPNVVESTYGHLLPNDARINDPWTQARAGVS
jgi:integrase